MTTWAGIVRVSHMGKRKAGDDSFHSERDQVKAMKDAVPKGDRLKVLPPELDVSGGLPLDQRPALKEAVEGVERGRYAGIVVAYQSRLGRDTEYEEAVWRRVEKAGGRIILALDGVDTTTVDGRMVRRIKSAMNTAERERHVEEFDRRRKDTVVRGIWPVRQTPIGYRKRADRRLEPDDRAGEVLRAFQDRAAAATISELARRLGMTTSGIRQMLQNRVYLGELRWGKHVNLAAHEPIVPDDVWHAAQRTQPRPPRSGTPALCAGILRCAGCGHVMSRTGPERTRAYACPRNHSGGVCPAPASIMAGRIDPVVDRYGKWKWDQLTATPIHGDNAANARKTLDDAQAELSAYLQAVSAKDVGVEAFAEGARGRREAVEDARSALDRELARRFDVPDGVEWEDVPVHLRNQFLRDALACVVVRRAGGRGARVPLADRVRILESGDYGFVGKPEVGAGIRPIPFPDVPPALGIEAFENPSL